MDRLSVVSLTLYPFTASDPAVIRVTTSVSDHLRNTKRTMVKYVTAASPYFATPAQDAGDAVVAGVRDGEHELGRDGGGE